VGSAHQSLTAMSTDRRLRIAGVTDYFTVATHQHGPILTLNGIPEILLGSLESARNRAEFDMLAPGILPEHLHCIWKMPSESSDASRIWALIQPGLIERIKVLSIVTNRSAMQSRSRVSCGYRAVLQRGFWENAIRDGEDLRQHVDYTHYNPVKHGLVTNPPEWSYSSFRRYVDQGYYENDWSEELELTVEGGSE